MVTQKSLGAGSPTPCGCGTSRCGYGPKSRSYLSDGYFLGGEICDQPYCGSCFEASWRRWFLQRVLSVAATSNVLGKRGSLLISGSPTTTGTSSTIRYRRR